MLSSELPHKYRRLPATAAAHKRVLTISRRPRFSPLCFWARVLPLGALGSSRLDDSSFESSHLCVGDFAQHLDRQEEHQRTSRTEQVINGRYPAVRLRRILTLQMKHRKIPDPSELLDLHRCITLGSSAVSESTVAMGVCGGDRTHHDYPNGESAGSASQRGRSGRRSARPRADHGHVRC
jgi:hypothetical protein